MAPASAKANPRPDQCLLVIFGASGDLTRRKLVPSLYDLEATDQLPPHMAVLGVSRTEMADEVFRDHLLDGAREFSHHFDQARWDRFSRRLYYQIADATRPDAFEAIGLRIGELAQEHSTGDNILFYLSLAPQFYEPVVENIGAAGLVTEGRRWCSIDRDTRPWQRIIVEKPFGKDYESAADLNRVLGRVFEEESIYRIDHYLGKDTVQNLLVFRFANAIFEPIWNRNYIDHVQVTAAETVGVEDRGSYYDSPGGGAMRDMIQSHLLQIMSLVAMEPPVTMRADDLRAEKTKVLMATRAMAEHEVTRQAVRAQYAQGRMKDQPVPGFTKEAGVERESQTETYAALQVFIDTWRWAGVPFYLRSGKRMARKLTEVVVQFKHTPHALFREEAQRADGMMPNRIVINVQPDEGIHLRFEGKVPGTRMQIKSVVMDFDYIRQFNAQPPEAYATLLLDAMRGDQTLFKNRDETQEAWRIVQPVLDHWSRHPATLAEYPAGSWGPAEAEEMLAREGRQWHEP